MQIRAIQRGKSRNRNLASPLKAEEKRSRRKRKRKQKSKRRGRRATAEKLAKELPSSTSKDYGRPFADIFKHYDYDFFKIDAMLFSPASVIVTAVDSGKSFRAGRLDNVLLDQSFGVN